MRPAFLLSLAAAYAGLTAAQDDTPPDGMGDLQIADALANLGINVTDFIEANNLTRRANTCSYACGALSLAFGKRLISQGSATYNPFIAGYWSIQQASVHPYCIFQPTSAPEVSAVILLSRLTQCPFAVKSGGHAAFAGASSIEGGITVDFSRMKSISLSSSKKTASVEPGNLWYDTYVDLNPQGVTIIGGRVASIGTGGLTTGGGISFYSNIYGWACDNVQNYEVVTAQGLIIQASPTSNSDLYWALRGGGNNFGIVTRFDYGTVPYTGMWGGSRIFTMDKFDAANQAFVNFGNDSPTDPNAAMIFIVGQQAGQQFTVADLQYVKPISTPPAIFSDFENITAVSDTTKQTSLVQLTEDFNVSNPNGLRETYWTATFKMNTSMSAFIKDTFLEEIEPIQDVPGLLPACVMQVITHGVQEGFKKNGGNPLGIYDTEGPLLLLNLAFMWNNTSDDAAVQRANGNIVKKAVAFAKANGLDNDYLYMNYASQYQDVIGGYGADNKAKLQSIAKKYDPAAVFETLQPGYFKLNGPPNSNYPS